MRRLLALALAGLLGAAVAAPVAARSHGQTIVDTAIAVNTATGEFDHLIAAVVRADLVDALDGNRQLTVFAPTDAAFEDLFDALGVTGVGQIPRETLRSVLLYHVVPGERFAADVAASTRLRTLSKGFIEPRSTTGTSTSTTRVS